jgi:hypothetical protein
MVRQVPLGRRDRRQAAIAAASRADERPAWARSAGPAEPVETKAGLASRMIAALGDTWGRLPERMSRISAPATKTTSFRPSSSGHAANGNGHSHAANGNGHSHAANGNGHAANGNGHAANGNGNGHATNGNRHRITASVSSGNGNGNAPRRLGARKREKVSAGWTPSGK